MNTKFKEGDIVKLKSGGPDMTIEKVVISAITKEASGFIRCVWFEGVVKHESLFKKDMLELVKRETS